jgi:predicted O-methyltransferase YrrM
MDKCDLLARLAQDRPEFHFIDEGGVQRAVNIAVTQGVLKWIADHLSDDMITLETGAGYTTVVLTALGKHHYCCTRSQLEADKIRAYLDKIGVSNDKLTAVIGSTDKTLPSLVFPSPLAFAYIDGCHGYPFPALDWHYIDKQLRVGGIVGMDNAELRPVREHCEFLEENGAYKLSGVVLESVFVRFYTKLTDQLREWVHQPYSVAKKDPCDWRLFTRFKRHASRWIKPHIY